MKYKAFFIAFEGLSVGKKNKKQQKQVLNKNLNKSKTKTKKTKKINK